MPYCHAQKIQISRVFGRFCFRKLKLGTFFDLLVQFSLGSRRLGFRIHVMAFGFVSKLQNLWPFSALKFDDIRASRDLVRELAIPEQTKQFIYVVRDPETESVVYVLSAQSFSERSALDVQCLVNAIKPEVVIAQVGLSQGVEILAQGGELEDGDGSPLPTSSFEVLRRCFVDKVDKATYEAVAGSLVMKAIFGVGFHGCLVSAKKAAKEAGSSFLIIESPCLQSQVTDDDDVVSVGDDGDFMNNFRALIGSFVPRNAFGAAVTSSSRRYLLGNEIKLHSQMVKLLLPNVDMAISSLAPSSSPKIELPLEDNYEAPTYAQSIYTLLLELHSIFDDIPSIGKALARAQKMLRDVNGGEAVDSSIVSEIYTFRIAVEAMRIALNNAGRAPIHEIRNTGVDKTEFSELSIPEKSQLLFTQALRAHTRKFKTTVVVIDPSSLAGLRRFWNDPVPLEVENMVTQLCDNDAPSQADRKSLLTGKPAVAVGVGAGATAVVGASWLSKAAPASTFVKAPFSLKLALAKAMRAATSAGKIRVLARGMIASVEKTSVSAARTAFYEIMRNGRSRPIGILPWAALGCSVATCSGLIAYGEGIERVAESIPDAPAIASLGRGVERLRAVSEEVSAGNVQKAIDSLTRKG